MLNVFVVLWLLLGFGQGTECCQATYSSELESQQTCYLAEATLDDAENDELKPKVVYMTWGQIKRIFK